MQQKVNFKINESMFNDIVNWTGAEEPIRPEYLKAPSSTLLASKKLDSGHTVYMEITRSLVIVRIVDETNRVLIKQFHNISDMPGYDFTGEYIYSIGDGECVIVVLDKGEDNDFSVHYYVELGTYTDFNGIDNFKFPEEECAYLDITGMWAIDIEGWMVHLSGINTDIRYSLSVTVTKDDEQKLSGTVCECVVFSDGKHYNKIVPVGLFENDEDRVPEINDSIFKVVEFAGAKIMLEVTRAD